MNASSVDIKDMLEAESTLGLVFGTNLFVGKEPAKSHNSVTIYDTTAFPPELALEGATGYEYPSIQIRVRNDNYLSGWDFITVITNFLHGKKQETINTTLYSLIACSSGPALLDYDEQNRPRFIVNFNIQRR
jgi:hypothetical protein